MKILGGHARLCIAEHIIRACWCAHVCVYIYIWVNYDDLTATSLEWVLVKLRFGQDVWLRTALTLSRPLALKKMGPMVFLTVIIVSYTWSRKRYGFAWKLVIPSGNQTWQWKIPYKCGFIAGNTIYKWWIFQYAMMCHDMPCLISGGILLQFILSAGWCWSPKKSSPLRIWRFEIWASPPAAYRVVFPMGGEAPK